MWGKLEGKTILDASTGEVVKVIYDYGIYINMIESGQIGVLEFSMWMLCAAGSFMALYLISSILDWISSSRYDKTADCKCAFERQRSSAEGKDHVRTIRCYEKR